MKVGILGSGQVGQVLAKAFTSEGYNVMLGTRDPAKEEVVNFIQNNTNIDAGTFEETALYGNILVLAVGGSAAESAIALAGIHNFAGKVVIDATNPIDTTKPPVNGVLSFTTGPNGSLMEKLQTLLPEAKLVKAFNSVGNAVMYKPNFKDTPTMFIAGNDEEAKETVSGILVAFGWEAADMGKAEAARAIEPLCILWCIPGFAQNDWYHAFKLLKA